METGCLIFGFCGLFKVMSIDKLIKEEVKVLIKEYFHSTQDNRQVEVQQFLARHVERDTLKEFIKNPVEGRKYVREHHTERFYWWANEDVEELFRNWK